MLTPTGVKNNKRFIKYLCASLFCLTVAYLNGCETKEPLTGSPNKVNTMTVIRDTLDIQKEGGSTSIIINTGADSWSINKRWMH